jgi:hypothetical protein
MMFLTMGITLALLFAALVLAYILSRQFTRPIGLLAGRMHAFSLEQARTRARRPATSMSWRRSAARSSTCAPTSPAPVKDLLQARERELESRMMALQSQMNPHFLPTR